MSFPKGLKLFTPRADYVPKWRWVLLAAVLLLSPVGRNPGVDAAGSPASIGAHAPSIGAHPPSIGADDPPSTEADTQPALVVFKQNFDGRYFPNVLLSVDCVSEAGEREETLLLTNEVFQFYPNLHKDPNQCWSCKITWIEAQKYVDFYIYSNNNDSPSQCFLPVLCTLCFWNADESGIFVYDASQSAFRQVYSWIDISSSSSVPGSP